MVEYDPTKIGQPMDLRTSARTTGFIALLGLGICLAVVALGMLLTVIAGFIGIGDVVGDRADAVWSLLLRGLMAATLGWFAFAVIVTSFAIRSGHAAAEIPRLGLAYGSLVAATAAFVMFLAINADVLPGSSIGGRLWGVAIVTLLAGAAFVTAALLGRRPVKQNHYAAAGFALGGALLLLVGGSMESEFGLFEGLGLYSMTLGFLAVPIAIMVLGGALITYAALSPSPTRAAAAFGVTGAAGLLGIVYLVSAIDLLADDPFRTVSFLTDRDGLAGTGYGLTVSGNLALGLVGIVAVVAAVLSSIVTGLALRDLMRRDPGQVAAQETAVPRATGGRSLTGAAPSSSYVLCPKCRGPNPRGSRFCNACGFSPGGA